MTSLLRLHQHSYSGSLLQTVQVKQLTVLCLALHNRSSTDDSLHTSVQKACHDEAVHLLLTE